MAIRQPVLSSDAVLDGVFRQRLQDQPGAEQIERFRRGVQLHAEAVAAPRLLDRQVGTDMINLAPNCVEIAAAMDG